MSLDFFVCFGGVNYQKRKKIKLAFFKFHKKDFSSCFTSKNIDLLSFSNFGLFFWLPFVLSFFLTTKFLPFYFIEITLQVLFISFEKYDAIRRLKFSSRLRMYFNLLVNSPLLHDSQRHMTTVSCCVCVCQLG